MKISLDWLSDFVDLSDISPEEVAENLTVHTAEVDGWEEVTRTLEGVVAARVNAVRPIEGAPGVREVEVDAGSARYRSVCGAPDLREGMIAAFAPAGAVAGGRVLSLETVRGQMSEGMLCSPAELGMGAAGDRLLHLPASVAPGTPLDGLVPARDVLVEIDNKSLTHRPDLWGHYGFARELAAIFGRPLRPYETAVLEAFDHLPAYPVEVEEFRDCPCYTAIEFDVSRTGFVPLRAQARMYALGSASLGPLVDATNYVQLELGQPTHAFDAAAVGRIRVAAAGVARSFTTLDGKTWALAPEDLLIHDGNAPVALAGIMGGQGSEVGPSTKRVLLESANFRGSRVRLTASRLGLRTDASLRFEKKLPPVFTRLAAGRILLLLERWGASPTTTSRFTVAGDLHDRERTIRVPSGWISERAGTPIEPARAAALLRSIGFGCHEEADGGLEVAVPSFRSAFDVSILEDVGEEVMRLYGYDRIAPRLPDGMLRPAPLHAPTRAHHRMRRLLSESHHFLEVQTYGWMDEEWLTTLGYEPAPTLNLSNPLGPTRRRMRDTLVPNVLAVAAGARRERDSFRVYELGRVFSMATGEKTEHDRLAGVSVEQGGARTPEAHFRAVRGAVEDLALVAGLPLPEFAPVTADGPPWLRAGAALEVWIGSELAGHLGVLVDPACDYVLESGHAVWFEVRTAAVQGQVYPAVEYRPAPVYPGSWQDFTLVWEVRRGYAELSRLLDGFTHPALESRAFVGAYRPAKTSETANYTVRFSLRLLDRTMTADEIQDFRDAVLVFLQRKGLSLA